MPDVRSTFDSRQVAVCAAGACTFMNLYSTQALLPTLAEQFGATLPHTGLTVTAPLMAVALVAPFVGSVSDALGRRRLIVAASLALAVPTALAAAAPGLNTLILCRFLQGLLMPFIFTVTVAYIGDEFPASQAVRVTGSYAVGTIAGGFTGRFLSGLVAQWYGWRPAFLVLAAVTLALALIVQRILPLERNFRPVRGWRGSLSSFGSHLHNGQVLATCAIGFAVLFSMVGTFTYANYHLAGPPFFLGPAQLGAVFVVYLLGAVMTPVATRAVGRFGRRPTLVASAGTAMIGLALTLLPSLAAAIAGLALVAAGVFIEQVLSISYVAAAGRHAKSTAVGLYVTAYYVGGSLGGVLPASVWATAGWAGCVALVMVVQAAALAIALRFWRHA